MADKKMFLAMKIGNVTVHLWTLLLFGASLFFDFFEMLLISYGITALHESAHIWVAKRCKVPIEAVEILPFGITMRVKDEFTPKPEDEIKICIAGPICNFVIAYLIYGFYGGAYREYIIISNIAMGVFNLLPALPLDGGRIMRALLVKRYGHIRATALAFKITKIIAFLIAASGLMVIYVTKFNFSFLVIGCFLTANLTEERKRSNAIIMKDILYSRKKLSKGGVSKGDVVVADMYEKAVSVIEKLSYDRYCLVNITNSKGEILKVATETEIIEKSAIFGMNVTLKKIVGI